VQELSESCFKLQLARTNNFVLGAHGNKYMRQFITRFKVYRKRIALVPSRIVSIFYDGSPPSPRGVFTVRLLLGTFELHPCAPNKGLGLIILVIIRFNFRGIFQMIGIKINGVNSFQINMPANPTKSIPVRK